MILVPRLTPFVSRIMPWVEIEDSAHYTSFKNRRPGSPSHRTRTVVDGVTPQSELLPMAVLLRMCALPASIRRWLGTAVPFEATNSLNREASLRDS